MNILEKIILQKKKEVKDKLELFPVKLLEQSVFFESPTVSLKKYLLRSDKLGIIAEIKRKSPSRGFINKYVNIERTSIGYMMAGASALSVLTDQEFFGGKNEDLITARKFNYCPILRKDFIVDEYQILEAKSIGADVILLLANTLSAKQIQSFTEVAHSLNMEVLVEIHEENELLNVNAEIDVLGVNNRSLIDFSVDVNRSISLINKLPKEILKISESGIETPQQLLELKMAGYNGFLIGDVFMRSSRPEEACKVFIQETSKLLIQES